MGAVFGKINLALPYASARTGRRVYEPKKWQMNRAMRPLARGNNLKTLAAGLYDV